MAHRVAAKRQQTHDVWTLELEPIADRLPPFAPGQFAMLYAFGAGEVPISISGDLAAAGAGSLVHTVRAVGAVSRALCTLDEGSQVGVRGPFGTQWPLAEAEGRDIVVVAGGVGLVPLLPVVHQVLAHRERFGRVTVAYGGRAPAELLHAEELARWRGRFDMDVDVTVDAAGPGWKGRVGVVTTLLSRAEFDPANTAAFVCGPEVMMRFAAAALLAAGIPAADIAVSLERSMKCAIGHCGHCQVREVFVCKDGPVLSYDRAAPLLRTRAL